MSRLSPGTILLAFVAVLFGLLGAYVVRQSLKPRAATAAAQPERTVVPVASMDLQAGRQLTMGDIALLRLTRDEMKKMGIKGAFMSNTQHLIGRILNADVARGTTFNTPMFYAEGLGPSIEARLKPGFRAVTVPVEADDALLGFASAGSWVDLLFRSDEPSRGARTGIAQYPETTVTLMEMVQVLALGKDTYEGAKRGGVGDRIDRQIAVTLAVTPDQAAALRIVEGRGVLSLALRRPDDVQNASAPAPKTLDEVMKQPRRLNSIDVYRGRRMDRVLFENDDDGRRTGVRIGRAPSGTVETADATAGTTAAGRK